MTLTMAGLLNEDVCCHLQHLHCKLQDFDGNQRFLLESVSFSLLHIINELYVDWTGAFRFPVKLLIVLPSTVCECR